MRRTKIVCTIGPASERVDVIRAMILAGMDVARLNFSHGTHQRHSQNMVTLRETAATVGKSIAVILDLQGPKIRTGTLLGDGPVTLTEGAPFTITTEKVEGDVSRVSTTYEGLPQDVSRGDKLLLADGRIELAVENIRGNDVECEVIIGGELGEHKGINLPGVHISAPSLTEKDKADLAFGVSLDVDYVAMSFVRSPDDVTQLKNELIRLGRPDIRVVAKIEKPEALDRIDEIIDRCDALMIARGDLGVEIPPEKVPEVQKRLILKCNETGRLVITATQMLESMIDSPRPTRAEASDVANAIYDGSDAIMLSGETAIGRFPVQAVAMMAKIADETDEAIAGFRRGPRRTLEPPVSDADAIGHATCEAVLDIGARTILCFTLSGSTAQLVSSYRPNARIVAATDSPETMRRLALYWGVTTIKVDTVDTTDEMFEVSTKRLLELGLAKPGEAIIITAGSPLMVRGTTNMLKVHRIEASE